jgi:acyl-CoA reductase-like NAD-dependent aldehyde dehydrogenase
MTEPTHPTHADGIERGRAVQPRTRPCIDGDFRKPLDGVVVPGATPRDGSVIAEVAAAGPRDVDRAVAATRRAFDDGRWAKRSPVDRMRTLLRFAGLVRARSDELDARHVTVPLGGFKPSGSGRDTSLHALDGCTQLKTTWPDLS